MEQADLIIRNARLVLPESEVTGDLAVTASRISAIGSALPRARDEIDAAGRILVPGGIDSHTHIAQRPIAGEAPSPDDFLTGTMAAAAGGTTTILSHSMCAVGDDPEAVLDAYIAQAEGRALIDYGAHLQLGEADPAFLSGGLARLAARGFTSVKLFTTYEGYTVSNADVLTILDAVAAQGLLACVHAEDDAMIRHLRARADTAGRADLATQAAVRPIEVEAAMIRRIAACARITGARTHIFHVSGPLALDEVTRAAARGVPITAETCPHYLAFTAGDLMRPAFEGAKFLVSPALRDKADQAALWEALADGRITTCASDHSPQHRMAQIARARSGAPMPYTAFSGGMPGLQTLLPYLFSQGVMAGRISLRRFVDVTAAEPARLFGLTGKGALKVGADADLTLWDPEARWTVRQADMQSRVDFTPYDGMEMRGRPVLTVSRGRTVMRGGVVDMTAAGHGRLARREGAA